MRILIVEDYAPLRDSIRQILEEEGYAVDVAADGDEGLWLARDGSHDVIVLDLMLPGVDGVEILRTLRREGSGVHVLILTARDTVDDRVRGLDAGADDYLVKPFAMAELLSRIRALIRRSYDRKDPLLRIGDLEVDTASQRAVRGGRALELTAREYALLEYLALRAGEVVSRSEVWEHIYDFHSQATSNVVDVYVGYLRKKLERDGLPRLIHTRRGQGYVLQAEAS